MRWEGAALPPCVSTYAATVAVFHGSPPRQAPAERVLDFYLVISADHLLAFTSSEVISP